MGWVLNAVYLLLVVLLTPVWVYRIVVLKKNRDGWGEKFLGRLPILCEPQALASSRNAAIAAQSPESCRVRLDALSSMAMTPDELTTTGPRLAPAAHNHERVWCHAVSVGEVLQLKPLLAELVKQQPDCEIVITTTTVTGRAVAEQTFPQHTVCYFPLDFTWACKAALKRIAPTRILLVELELWPNFIRAAAAQNIPVSLVNGRISERSHRGYRRVRWLMRPLLQKLSLLAVQSETYATRLIDLGAPADRVLVTGSVKFDGIHADRTNPLTQELRSYFGIAANETVFIAGSTQSPEEQIALEVYQQLQVEFPKLRLILVPRHKERFPEVAQLVTAAGQRLLRRSEPTESASSVHNDQPKPVLLLDTLGELAACWGLAEIAYVGGSMHVGRGGQNMMEPAGYGAFVTFGPDTRNFRDVVELLRDSNAARVVQDAAELAAAVRWALQNPDAAAAIGTAAQQLVFSQQGATAKTIAAVFPQENPAITKAA